LITIREKGWIEMSYLKPNEDGNYPCPHCDRVLTPIFRVSLLHIDYFCHKCKIMFRMKVQNHLARLVLGRKKKGDE